MVGVFLLVYISVNLFLQSQGLEIKKAKIFSENTEVPEGGKLEVTCSTFGFTNKAVYLYLTKDGKAIDMKNGPAQRDITFKKERIEMDDSGNYSCVFSEEQLEIIKVTGYGHNIIFINVIESFINSQIHLLKSEVAVGSDAGFNCKISSPINKNLSNNMILAFLIKNEKPIKVNIWDTEEMMTTFTLREVRMEDAGTYSCAILLNTLPYQGMRLDQNNTVNLQIVVASYSSFDKTIIVIMCSTIVLLLSLFLGIWAVIRKRGCLGFHKERSLNETELRGNDVFYEEISKPDTAGTGEIRSVVCTAAVWEESSDSDAMYDDLDFQQS
ncbi:uncharacterized protein LOC127499904 isoform X2 [Ctenopharyngodon idella]|uniref:uncharacterized protein LOC127499904 isoform X2 n=1 Tax=Ctenopharyngodon idella TaxID=7959 RepID=UPI002231EE00|nr:uncharacterized protein LOC127499904 isoform X2 [Ctenopharyngodon idella]